MVPFVFPKDYVHHIKLFTHEGVTKMAARTARTETAPAAENAETTPAVETAPEPMIPITVTAPVKAVRFDADTLTKIKGAAAWRPKDGETLTGTIIIVTKRTGEFGPYPCVVLHPFNYAKDDEGNDTVEKVYVDKFVAVHAFHGVLANELRDLKAGPGLDITTLYTGKRTANRLNTDGTEKNYHGYSVVPSDGGEIESFDFTADEV